MSIKKIAFLVLAAAVVAFMIYAYATTDKRTDEQLVAAFVKEGEEAVNDRDFSKVMDMVSEDFKADDMNKARFRVLVAQAFRGDSNLSVEATPISTVIRGDTANLKVKVSAIQWNLQSTPVEREISVTLAKETGKRLLLLPTVKWRCTGTDSLVLDHEGW